MVNISLTMTKHTEKRQEVQLINKPRPAKQAHILNVTNLLDAKLSLGPLTRLFARRRKKIIGMLHNFGR